MYADDVIHHDKIIDNDIRSYMPYVPPFDFPANGPN